jgi:hypothetical protein
MDIFNFISGIFKPAADLVDELHTSGEEKLELENKKLEIKKQIQEIQAKVTSELIDYQSKLDNLQADVVKAEASSSSWLARNWRPITMLVFVALVVGRYLGWISPSNEDAFQGVESQIFNLIQIGLGGYVVGRSAEKIVSTYSQSKKKSGEGAVG